MPVPFDRQPTLRGSLVTVEPLRPEHFQDLFAVASDPLVWEQHPARDRYREPVFRQLFEESLASGGALLVRDAADGRVIGSSRYHGYDPDRSEVEIGWTFLARSHWGGRYNAELKELMLRHVFGALESVIFLVGPENVRSRRAVEKIGGVRAPERDRPEFVVYRITASDFGRRDQGERSGP